MSNSTSYDKALLDEAPEVTPQQRQRFYDADLLNDGSGNGALPAGAAAPATRSNTDLEAGAVSGTRSKEYTALPPSSSSPGIRTAKTPWYKTRKGIIGLVILAIIIVGAVVGGAVGGTVGKNDNDNDNSSDSSASQVSTLGPSISPTATTQQGSAPVGTGSPTSTTTAQEAPIGTSTETTTPDSGQQGSTNGVSVANDG